MSYSNPNFEPESQGPQGDSAPVANAPRELVLVKHGQKHVFRYAVGEEVKLLSSLAEMARDPKSEIDWFDAAVLSHQMGRTLSQQLSQMSRT